MSVRSICRPSHEGKHNAFKQSSLFAHFSTLVPKFNRKHFLPVAFSRVPRSAVFMVFFCDFSEVIFVWWSCFHCIHVILISFCFVRNLVLFPCHNVYLHLQWIFGHGYGYASFLYLRSIESRLAQCGFQTVMRSGVQICFPRFCHDFLT